MARSRPKLLIVEDDPGLCSQYRWSFPGSDLLFAANRALALAVVAREKPPVVLVDLGLPPDPDGVSEGFALLDEIVRLAPRAKVIVVTSHGDREHARRAVAAGAYDFCEKPVELGVLTLVVDRAQHVAALEEENRRLAETPSTGVVKRIITADPGMLKVCQNVERLASANVSVLLIGESGTGKEGLAHALHDLGPRAGSPFVAINCGAIPENLLESELFGHERGAFTGAVSRSIGKVEQANKGTLFLDEIGDLPHSLQVKLLRFLQEQVIERVGGRVPIRVDVRVVSATNMSLENQIAAGHFRSDLFYRLNPVTLRIPPLRDRRGDVLLLARWFLVRFNQEFSRSLRGFSDDALTAMELHSWPGNVRELENRVKRATLMAETRLATAADLELVAGQIGEPDLNLRTARGRIELEMLQRAIARSNGVLTNAAKLLGISRPTLYAMMEAHSITADPAQHETAPAPTDESDDRTAQGTF